MAKKTKYQRKLTYIIIILLLCVLAILVFFKIRNYHSNVDTEDQSAPPPHLDYPGVDGTPVSPSQLGH